MNTDLRVRQPDQANIRNHAALGDRTLCGKSCRGWGRGHPLERHHGIDCAACLRSPMLKNALEQLDRLIVGDRVKARGRFAGIFSLRGCVEAIEDGRIGVRISNGNFDWFDTDNVMGI